MPLILLTLILLIAKLAGAPLTWWVVFLPIWLPLAILSTLLAITAVTGLVLYLYHVRDLR